MFDEGQPRSVPPYLLLNARSLTLCPPNPKFNVSPVHRARNLREISIYMAWQPRPPSHAINEFSPKRPKTMRRFLLIFFINCMACHGMAESERQSSHRHANVKREKRLPATDASRQNWEEKKNNLYKHTACAPVDGRLIQSYSKLENFHFSIRGAAGVGCWCAHTHSRTHTVRHCMANRIRIWIHAHAYSWCLWHFWSVAWRFSFLRYLFSGLCCAAVPRRLLFVRISFECDRNACVYSFFFFVHFLYIIDRSIRARLALQCDFFFFFCFFHFFSHRQCTRCAYAACANTKISSYVRTSDRNVSTKKQKTKKRKIKHTKMSSREIYE